ncbi:TPA: histidine--tRNA ligase [Candidatus Dependentiae bacterium]|nr:MAG: Histidine-tRNA ligase [candidate division TM6 bacterium GW2011_GWE2_31_21]KKP53941.1 MAG: Histidine-tRNA ligase [candidate division TM6 bacterium GW2011_GWF2_33_332]HBS47721.1 histidine--tRNA ligase [Candidatus Dependentiae bacterium]HBZ73870.1 histidine--tRNA ligase [Candidatus Dependentiae bacterium]
MFSKVRGTEDLLDLTLYNFLIDEFKKHLNLYNFIEIQTPILEHTNLFVRSLGSETDVVTKEMYTFKSGSEESICLRPEATAPTMRAFLENQPATPWKVYAHGPMFRHERPQKGRWRQFSQFNIEIIGASSIAQDANIIKMFDSFFSEKLKFQNYILKINFLGVSSDRVKFKEELYKFLQKNENDICETCKVRKEKNILRVFDCKEEKCAALYKTAPKLVDFLSDESKQEWEYLQKLLTHLSVNFVYDSSLVRGLDYYNKTVFEFCSSDLGAQTAFGGGGRYDGLALELGSSQDYPSIGAGFGIGRILMILDLIKDKLVLPQTPSLNVIIPLSKDEVSLALLLADAMQAANLCTDLILDNASVTNMMKKANKMGAKYVLILGESERMAGTVSVKNMQTGEAKVIKQSEVVSFLK